MKKGDKNTLLIVAGIAILGIIAYFMFFKGKSGNHTTPTTPQENLGETPKGEKITESMVQLTILKIKNWKPWYDNVKKSAYENAHTLEQELRNNAIWWLQNN